MRTVAVTVAAVTTALLAGLVAALSADPAHGSIRAVPGSFTGYAFDSCQAPSQRRMDHWLKRSRYWGVGIYIAGMNRGCDEQPHLTRRWVETQRRNGWRLLPVVVGRQASCSPKGHYRGRRISDAPADEYAEARGQGRDAATAAVEAAHDLGIGRHSVLWFDLESFDIGQRRCRRSALAFLSAWTYGLHHLHYRSGFYSSASTGITLVDRARSRHPGRYHLPDLLWIGEWNRDDSVSS